MTQDEVVSTIVEQLLVTLDDGIERGLPGLTPNDGVQLQAHAATREQLHTFLTVLERRRGLPVDLFGLVATAKAALAGTRTLDDLIRENARIHGLEDMIPR